ncbi:MAG: hypothetical protein WC443_08700 [Desulfobaccales bacterium]
MIFKPGIIALLTISLLLSGMLLYSAFYGVSILRYWDIKSGSERQLRLERRTYLISSIMGYALVFQLFSFFLFIYTADALHPFFTGAMCAVGSLNVNQWGYPVVILKIITFLLGGLWLIINFADNRGYDYPLIKEKYLLLLVITPLILAETLIQLGYFLGLKPEVITSCCGSLFTSDAKGVASEIIALPRLMMEIAFYVAMLCTLTLGVAFYRTAKLGYWFALAVLLTFLISAAAFISFISIYFYELPTHHCPFCILQKEYGYIGYFLYLTLLVGGLSGLGAGVLMPSRRIPSLEATLPGLQKTLTLISIVSYGLFGGISTFQIAISNLKM